jgi:hypothetical protein
VRGIVNWCLLMVCVDFVLDDFGDTSVLRLNGRAATSSCAAVDEVSPLQGVSIHTHQVQFAYNAVHGTADSPNPAPSPAVTVVRSLV